MIDGVDLLHFMHRILVALSARGFYGITLDQIYTEPTKMQLMSTAGGLLKWDLPENVTISPNFSCCCLFKNRPGVAVNCIKYNHRPALGRT